MACLTRRFSESLHGAQSMAIRRYSFHTNQFIECLLGSATCFSFLYISHSIALIFKWTVCKGNGTVAKNIRNKGISWNMLMVLNTRRMDLDTGQLKWNLSTRKNLYTFDTTATCFVLWMWHEYYFFFPSWLAKPKHLTRTEALSSTFAACSLSFERRKGKKQNDSLNHSSLCFDFNCEVQGLYVIYIIGSIRSKYVVNTTAYIPI